MDRPPKRQFLTGLLALGWLVAAFIGYIYIHKPFSTADLSGILLGFWRTLVAITIISVAGGIGFLTDLRKLDTAPLTLAMLTAAFGCGIIGIVILLAGATIGVNIFLWIILIAAGLLLRRQVFAWWKCWQELGSSWQKTGRFGKALLCLTILILACQYFVALAPPLQFDALTYHLAIPKTYIQIGHIAYLPENIFWGMPQQTEMLYTLTMLIGGTEAAPLLGWWIGLLVLAGLAGLAEKIFNPDAAWVAVASLMCASALTGSLSSGYVEWAGMLFGLSMSVCLFEWSLSRGRSILLLAGLFAGLALGTKYTAGVALLSGLIVILLFRKPFSIRQTAANLLVFGGAALVITLPWWIKNFVATSNPFYPLLIPAGSMDALRLAFYQFSPPDQDWSRLLLLPWQITVWGIDGGGGYSASIGPLLLGLGVLAVFDWQHNNPEQRLAIKICGTILLAGLLIWTLGSEFRGLLIQTRLYFVIFPAWALLCAAGYSAIVRVRAQGVRFGNIVGALILLALTFNAFAAAMNTINSGAVAAALNTDAQESYLQNNLGVYEAAMQTLKALPDDSHVVMLWETRGLECLPMCDADEIIDRWYHDWTFYRTPAAIIQAWKQQGYHYVLLYRLGADFVQKYHKPDLGPVYWNDLNTTLSELHLVKDIYGAYQLYSIP